MGIKSIVGLKADGEAPIYNIFIGAKGVTMGSQVNKFIPRNQTWIDYDGEERWTYKMINPFKPSQIHTVVGVNDALQLMLPLLVDGQPQNVGGYTARVVFQDFFGNVLHQVIPPQLEHENRWYKRSYYLLRKEFSKFLRTLDAMTKRDELSRKVLLNLVKEYRGAFYSRPAEEFSGFGRG